MLDNLLKIFFEKWHFSSVSVAVDSGSSEADDKELNVFHIQGWMGKKQENKKVFN